MIHETPAHWCGTRLPRSSDQMAFATGTRSPPFFGLVSSFTTLALLPVFLAVYAVALGFVSERLRARRAG